MNNDQYESLLAQQQAYLNEYANQQSAYLGLGQQQNPWYQNLANAIKHEPKTVRQLTHESIKYNLSQIKRYLEENETLMEALDKLGDTADKNAEELRGLLGR